MRVNGLNCGTCKWWDNEHPRLSFAPEIHGINQPGFCRKHKHGGYTKANEHGEAYSIGIQPITDADECCGEYRRDE